MKASIGSIGWFYPHRGNWYGPLSTYEKVEKEFVEKNGYKPDDYVRPVYGTAIVENQRLLDFKFQKPPCSD